MIVKKINQKPKYIKKKIKNGKGKSVADVIIKFINLEDKELNSLKGSPKKVDHFDVSYNNLKNLIGGPKYVKNYYASYNQLESLEGSPKEVEYFHVAFNKLKNLIGSPKYVKIYNLYNNQLETLEGDLKRVDVFNISTNPTLKNTNGIPKKIGSLFLHGTIHSADQFTEYPDIVDYIHFDTKILIEDIKEIISNIKEVGVIYIDYKKYTKEQILKM